MTKEYWLQITPETHVRATQADIVCFRVFGPLHKPDRSEKEEILFNQRKEKYPDLYRRFKQLERYNDYKRRLHEEAILRGFWLRDSGMEVTFYMPVPPSWRPGKKKKFHLQPHQSRPDVDNIYKAAADILRPHQDNAIWHIKELKKVWVNEPQGYIHIICHPEQPIKIKDPQHELEKNDRGI